MINKTKDYDIFVFRQDNRERINQAHVERLVSSISSRNLLELRPITVNKKMEIIDGQHRLLAAKKLGIPIYYEVGEDLNAEDIIRMNVSQNWKIGDYLNFYCQHQYVEYVKLKDFMIKNNLTIKVALCIALGVGKESSLNFKNGNFKFHDESLSGELKICHQTIEYIIKMNGYSAYTKSARFWRPLLKLIKHPEFEAYKWLKNMQMMISHFSPKAREDDYMKMFQHIYNWKNTNKIRLVDNI